MVFAGRTPGNHGPQPASAATNPAARVQRLEAELLRSEARLTEALAEVTRANAELRASTEEQRNLYEELRASNEELAASESELRRTNDELAGRVDDLAHINSDLRSVIESTRIAIVFLDAALRIRSFTPAVQDVLHVREADRGRPITDLALQLAYPGLASDVHRVLRSHERLERQAGHLLSGAQYLVRLLPYHGGDGQVSGVVVTFLDVSATVQAEQALRASDERFRRMAAAVPALLFIAGPARSWEYVNPPFYALTGQQAGSALGEGWTAALHPDDLIANRSLWDEAEAAASTLEHEARLRRADGTWCWFLIRAVPQLDPAGRPLRWYGSCTDIDDRQRAEKRQGLLLADLQHRIKNILAVVRSVLTRTLKSSTGLDHFAAHLAGRIGALARTQSVSARTAEGFVMLEDIVYQELAAHGGQNESQVLVEGPPVPLPVRTANSLGLAIHELATNSIKYGALAAQTGQISVTWRMEAVVTEPQTNRVIIEWLESGVPLTDMNPARRGFGRELIEQGLPYELGARTAMKFRPGGLCCTIDFELNQGANRSKPASGE